MSSLAGLNAFWHSLKATERSFLHLYADALSSSNSCFMSHLGEPGLSLRGGQLPLPQHRTAHTFNHPIRGAA